MSRYGMKGSGMRSAAVSGAGVDEGDVLGGQGQLQGGAEERLAEGASSAGRSAADVVVEAMGQVRAGAAPVPGRALARVRARERARRGAGAGSGAGAHRPGGGTSVRLVLLSAGESAGRRGPEKPVRVAHGPGRRRTGRSVPEARGAKGGRRRIRAARAAGVRRDAGMATSEYAMALLAAVAFAGVLYKIVTGGAVASALQAAVEKALDAPF